MAVTILITILGPYWYIFAGYLFCNVLHWLMGWYKARKLARESSKSGMKGILIKLACLFANEIHSILENLVQLWLQCVGPLN